jgi:hypothetical protein
LKAQLPNLNFALDEQKQRIVNAKIQELEHQLREEKRARRLIMIKMETLQDRVALLEQTERVKDEAKIADAQLRNIILAIQDFNAVHKWEQAHPEYADALYAIRSSRVNACHYVLDDDSGALLALKQSLAYEKLQSLSVSIIQKVEEICESPGIVDSIASLFNPSTDIPLKGKCQRLPKKAGF